MLTALLIFISCCFFIFSTWNTMYRKNNLPPGPTPLPLIGNLLHIHSGALVDSLMKLWKQYGPVYTLYFGPHPVVVLCGYEAVKEALVHQAEEFGGRGPLPTLEKFTGGYGISLSNGERWKTLRTFTLKSLKSFGKKSIEEKIQEEALCAVEEINKYHGVPVNPNKFFMSTVSNVLCSVMFGDRYEYNDEKFSKLLFIVNESFDLASSRWGQLYSILPSIMQYIPGPHHKIIPNAEKMADFISERAKACQESMNPDSPRHFIDSFLIKIDQEKDNPGTQFNMRNLLVTGQNLFVAGIETVNTTLQHSFLILLKYPEIQAKLQEEIDRVIGQERIPKYDDRADMPFTQAVISEVQRFSDVLPLNVPHMVTRDTQFRGYLIPKSTVIYPLLCTVHRDPEVFSTPYKFNPDHFLNENGQFRKNDALMPFSAGKRICPGESLARMELFIFLTTILQKFTLTSNTEFTESDIAPRMAGFLNAALDFDMFFVPRKR